MRLGILIPTYNRPQYLRRCLASLQRAQYPVDTVIAIVDDASDDVETLSLIANFMIEGIFIAKFFMPVNRSIKYSAKFGFDKLFDYGCDEVMIIDADAIVRNDFIYPLLRLRQGHPDAVITGFNCETKNRNGTVRHKIVSEGDGYNLKASVGGINMMFRKPEYEHFVEPALADCAANGGNWDHKTCLRMQQYNSFVVCAVPSVIQHIGVESAMGHGAGGEPPDVADDFITLNLPQVTLVGADCVDVHRLLRAAEASQRNIMFGDVKLFSSIPHKDCYMIPHMASKGEYSDFMMKELGKHLQTDYVLVIQHDGYVLNAEAWRNEWFEYDYIGAPWEWYTDGMNVGNGGFSLRSSRLHKILASDPKLMAVNEDGVTKNREEDHCICRIYRKYLEETYRIKFAPIEEARKFSIEGWRSPNKIWKNEFGYHGATVLLPKTN